MCAIVIFNFYFAQKVYEKIVGNLEAYYLEKKPVLYEGLFLKEKRDLIEAITKRLGRITERKRAEEELKAANQQLWASEQQLKASNQQLRANEQQLRSEVAERKKMEEETEKHLHDLEIFYKANIGREERIMELKKRIKELEKKPDNE